MVDEAEEAQDKRWDQHTARQVEVAKGAIAAVTILNSGSWLALLTQAGKLSGEKGATGIGAVFLAWGFGAFFGTLTWILSYLNTLALQGHDFDRDNRLHQKRINWTIRLGLGCVVVSLACFLIGVFALAASVDK